MAVDLLLKEGEPLRGSEGGIPEQLPLLLGESASPALPPALLPQHLLALLLPPPQLLPLLLLLLQRYRPLPVRIRKEHQRLLRHHQIMISFTPLLPFSFLLSFRTSFFEGIPFNLFFGSARTLPHDDVISL